MTTAPRQVAFIVDDITDYQTLIAGMPAGIAVHVLDARGDALAQMADILAAHEQLDAIHVFSHGSAAAAHLGSTVLNSATLDAHAETLARIGASLTEEGDFLLYGCNVAWGEAGRGFVESIARITQADVAASDDVTGAAALGGNWILEHQSRDIDVDPLDVAGYDHLLVFAQESTTFSGVPAGNVYYSGGFLSANTFSVPATLSEANVAGTGWDVVARTNDAGGTFAIRGMNQTGFGDGDSTSIRITGNYVETDFKSNGGSFTFDLSGFTVRVSAATTMHVRALDASGNLTGLAVSTVIGSTGVFVPATSMAGNSDFNDIYGFRVTFTGAANPAPYFDNISVTDIKAPVNNTAPTLSATSTNPTFTEDAGATTALFSGTSADVVDSGQTFSGMTLTVSSLGTGDTLSIGGATVALTNGNSVPVGSGTASVSVTAGTATVTLSGLNLDNTGMNALINGITFNNTATDPGTATRTVTITQITDSGASNNTASPNIASSVAITNVNDAPTDIALSVTSITQSGGTNATVGTLSTTDVDTGQTHSYSLASGTGDTHNSLFNISGSTLRANDASTMAPGTYSVRVETSDGAGGTYQESFSITVNDNVAPVFDESTPSTANVNATSLDLSASLNEAGTLYYVVVADGASAPSAAQVRAGQDAGGSAALKAGSAAVSSGAFTHTFNLTGLTAETAYDIYVVGEDDEGSPNLMAVPVKLDVTTPQAGPTVTDDHISITSTPTGTSSTYRIGDTITAQWDNSASGQKQSGITAVSMDFSAFGGSNAVTATNNGSGLWSASYTLASGSIDASDLNVSISATNGNGTTTTADTTNLTVDNQAPTVDDARIAISGASGTGGAFRIGDTVTATWNNTASGDNNSDTISGVTFDFSQFGGGAAVAATNSSGTWTATYTIVAGSIDNQSNRNVSVTATDNAGNTTTVAGTDNVTVDNQAPTAPGTPDLAAASDNGSSSTDDLTSDTTPTFTGSGAVANGTVTLYSGSTAIGTTTADASGNWSFTPGSDLAAGTHSITVTTTDAAGNVSAASAALSLNIDTSAPVIGSVSIPNAPMKIGDVVTATITVTSDTDSYTLSSGSIGGFTLGSLTRINDTTYTATFTVTSGGTDVAAGSYIPVSLVFTDGAGNSNTAYTTAISQSGDAINASAPTDIALSNATLSTSASANSAVGTLSSTDATPGDTFTYALVTGDGDTDNASFAIVGNQLQAIDPSAMTAGSKSIRVQTTDAAGNTYVEQMSVTVTTNPTVTITSSASTLKAGETATLTFTFSETPSGFEDGDITIAGGTLSGLTVDSGNDKVYTATFTPDANAQSLSGSLSIAAGTFKNASDQDNLASNTLTISGDTLRPTITSIERQTPALETTNADTLVYRVTFSEAVTSLDTGDFSVSGSTATVTSVSQAGTGNAYDVTLSGGDLADLNATVTLSLASGQNITDSAGNTLSNTTPGTNQVTYVVDNTAPSLNTAGSTPSDNATTVPIGSALTLRFSEALADTSDLTGVYLRNSDTDALVPATVTLNGNGELVITPSAALAYSTAYYVSWAADALKDAAGNAMAAVSDKTTFNFTTTGAPSSGGGTPTPPPVPPVVPPRDDWATLPDNDGDGIPEQVENLVPSLGGGAAGDGNGDGIPDVQQANVSSIAFRNTEQVSVNPDAPVVFVTLVGGSEAGIPGSAAAGQITSAQQLDAPADRPANLAMPLGLIGFTAVAAQAGASETFSLFVDGDVAVNGYWKQNTSGTWVNLASAQYGGRVVSENGKTRLDFVIEDGGEFDDDGVADGIISDPGAPGWFASTDDSDNDQFPDSLEPLHGLSVGIKDNDVFNSSKFFVMQLYRDILDREAEEGGLLFWKEKLDSNAMDRAQIASAFLDSHEFQTGTGAIARLYLGALGRLPDNEGLHFWIGQFQQSADLRTLAQSFADSAEFLTRYAASDNERFVGQLYENILGRGGDAAGISYWKQSLDAGLARSDALLSFTESAEYRQMTDTQVNLMLNYAGLLGRSPDQQGFDFWLDQRGSGMPEESVIHSFLAASEYHDRFLPSLGNVQLAGVLQDPAALV